MSALADVRAFVRLGRPRFLAGGFVTYGLGSAVAWSLGARRSWSAYGWGQGAVSAFQLMTHYANDYFDFEADCLNTTPTRWSGGSRVLAQGDLPRQAALVAAGVLAVAGWFLTVYGFFARPAVMAIFAGMFVLAWAYSGPPFRFHSTGWGALNVALVVSGLVPTAGFAIQGGGPRGVPVLAATLAAPFLLQFAMITAIDVPDAEGDRRAGKRTLVVRWGVARAERLYLATTALAFAVPWVLPARLIPRQAALALALVTPLAAWQAVALAGGAFRKAERWPGVAFRAVAVFALAALSQLVAFGFLSR